MLKNTINRPTGIYIGVGKEGLTPTAIPRVMEVDANLLFEKIKELRNENIQVYYDYLPQEDHATIMHQAVANAFKLLYSTKQPKWQQQIAVEKTIGNKHRIVIIITFVEW